MEKVFNNAKADHYRAVLARGESLEIKVNGYCMWPFLSHGTTVCVEPSTTDNIRVGDLVLTYVDDKFFCHRVFRRTKQSIQTKADALVGLDAEVADTQVLGRVVAKRDGQRLFRLDKPYHRFVGKIIAWLTFFTAPSYPFLRKVKKTLKGVFAT